MFALKIGTQGRIILGEVVLTPRFSLLSDLKANVFSEKESAESVLLLFAGLAVPCEDHLIYELRCWIIPSAKTSFDNNNLRHS